MLSIYTAFTNEGRPLGITRILGRTFVTTGVLGRSEFNGRPAHRAFPAWMTNPSAQDLATGRVWHLFFAWVFVVNGLVYLGYSMITRYFFRAPVPRREQWRQIGRSVLDHLTLRVRKEPAAADYNIIQRATYLTVVMVLAPVVVLTGLTMSPAVTAAAPWLLDIFGGR